MKNLLLLFLFTIISNAQIKGVVKDSITKEPIAYAALVYESTVIGTNANLNGEFELTKHESNIKIIVSCLGYKSKTLQLSNIKEIYLSPKEEIIEEVVITTRKNTSEIVVGDYKKIEFKTGISNIGNQKPRILAKLINSNDKIEAHPFIKNLEFPTDSDLNDVLLRIRIFNVDEDENPTTDAVFDDILVNVKKGKCDNFVDLSEHNIIIPKTGVIIGFEYLILPQNKHEFNHISAGVKVKTFSYEPTILAFYGNTGSTMLLDSDGTNSKDFNVYNSIEIPIKLTLTN